MTGVGDVPRGFDVGERYRTGIEFESATADFGGNRRQFGEDVEIRDRPLPAADNLQTYGTQCGGKISADGPAAEPTSSQVSGFARSDRWVAIPAITSAVTGPHR